MIVRASLNDAETTPASGAHRDDRHSPTLMPEHLTDGWMSASRVMRLSTSRFSRPAARYPHQHRRLRNR